MASLNKVFLIGNLTQDPDLRRIPAGTAVSTLRLAVNEAYLSKAGERVERTVYVDVDVWDRQAENCQQHLSKGSPVFIEGRLQMDQWEDRETHVKRSRLKVRADRVQFLGGRRGAAGAPAPAPAASAPPPPQAPAYEEPLSKPGDEEDVPF
ncbi:MAG: single-stranded DNA-binding protein [Kiritimatiellae bacterium]|nr:single-stranded DNA-binding protein [Kiritimatiellia bacterium]MBR4190061.1 single-stranded DNA-binding protein [Kiritimatiellia bacterium]